MPNRIDRILDIIGHGQGNPGPGVARPIATERCARGQQTNLGWTGCAQPVVDGHDFCADCLAWLRGDSDDDPLS